MTRKGCILGWAIGIVAVLFIFLLIVVSIEYLLGERISFPTYGARVGLVRIEGIIADPREAIEDLKQMEDDPGIRSVVLRISSPGGGVAASQEIYQQVVRLRDAGKPVVASMGAVAASGGYYVACPADTILANAGSITGSIGVIMSFPNMEVLFEKIGMKFSVVKSGELKDSGSLSREMTEEERAILQYTVDDIFNQFMEAIAVERHLDPRQIEELSDARILSGRQAIGVGLVDRIGTLEDAIELAARMGGIEGEPRVQEPIHRRRGTLWDLLTGAVDLVQPDASTLGAQYLYRPFK